MKLKLLTTAMVIALLSMCTGYRAEAQPRGGHHGGGYGYNHGGNRGYSKGRTYAPRYGAQRGYYGGNRYCGPGYNNRVVYYGNYYPPVPRYRRVVRTYCPPPPIVNGGCYGRGYNTGGYYGGGSGVSVNVNTPGFSGSFNSGYRGW